MAELAGQHNPADLQIARVRVEAVLPVRHTVLWPEQPLDFSRLADDAQGLHFAARMDGAVVAVASLFIQDGRARLRKFATLPAWQGQGVGSALLRHLLEVAREAGCAGFWCDARQSAAPFYARFGLRPEGEPWLREGVLFVRMGCAIAAQ